MEINSVSIKEWLIATGYMEEKTDYILLNNDIETLDLVTLEEIKEHISEFYQKPLAQVADEDLLAYHKEAQNKKLERRCQKEILNGFTSSSSGHTYRTNIDDQINILGKTLELVIKTLMLNVTWKTEDSGVLDHLREDFFEVFFESIHHKESKIAHLWQKKYEVSLCSSHEEINLIEW